MRKFIITISILLFVFIGSIFISKPLFKPYKNTDTLIHKVGCRLFDFNTLSVKTDESISISDIEIKIDNNTVFMNGKHKNRISQQYGDAVLNIYHKKVLIAQVGHFKKNNWYCNDYHIHLYQVGSDIFVNHKIEGPCKNENNFQKRYIYNKNKTLTRIDFINLDGEIYHSKKQNLIK